MRIGPSIFSVSVLRSNTTRVARGGELATPSRRRAGLAASPPPVAGYAAAAADGSGVHLVGVTSAGNVDAVTLVRGGATPGPERETVVRQVFGTRP